MVFFLFISNFTIDSFNRIQRKSVGNSNSISFIFSSKRLQPTVPYIPMRDAGNIFFFRFYLEYILELYQWNRNLKYFLYAHSPANERKALFITKIRKIYKNFSNFSQISRNF